MIVLTRLLIAASFVLVTGCAAKQTITEFQGNVPQSVCIANHQAVKEGVLHALEKGFQKNGTTTTVIQGNYVLEDNSWKPTINSAEAKNCDAIAFYVANWAWDLAMYMHFANVWITDQAGAQKLAQSIYQAGAGPSKFIDAETKIIELVDEMYKSIGKF